MSQQWENIQLKEEEERGDATGLVAPFPAPKTVLREEVTSPADSVFSQQDSISSTEDYRSAHDRTPSPDRTEGKSTPVTAPVQVPVGQEEVPSPTTTAGGERREQEVVGRSPPSAARISDFHKTLSDLAHAFSSILLSENEEKVLNSAK